MPAITIPGTSIKYGWQEREKGWGPGMNTNLLVLGVIAKGQIVSRTTNAPPANPDEGDAYIIPADATGTWSGRENEIAAFFSDAWVYIEPVGSPMYVLDEDARVFYDGTAWSASELPQYDFSNQSAAAGNFTSLADTDKLLGVDVDDSDTPKNLTLAQLAASQSMATSHVKRVTDLAALRALTGMQANQAVEMVTTGRAGLFRWDSSDLSAEVTADTQMGIYVPPTGQDGSSGAWVRRHDEQARIEWFGADASSSAATIRDALEGACGIGLPVAVGGHYDLDNSSTISVSGDLVLVAEKEGDGFTFVGGSPATLFSVSDGGSVQIRGLAWEAGAETADPLNIILTFDAESYLPSVTFEGNSFQGKVRSIDVDSSLTTDPSVTPFGIGELTYSNNSCRSTVLTHMRLNNTPVWMLHVAGNEVTNFGHVFINCGLSNGAANEEQVWAVKRRAVIEDNNVVCEDDFWPETVSTYYCFVLYEGVEAVYRRNNVEGLKTDQDTALYDAYLSAERIYYLNNEWKNNIRFTAATTNNTLIKAKEYGVSGATGDGLRVYKNNSFVVEPQWLEAIGKTGADAWVNFYDIAPGADFILTDNVISVAGLAINTSSEDVNSVTIERNTISADYLADGSVLFAFRRESASVSGRDRACSICDNVVTVSSQSDERVWSFFRSDVAHPWEHPFVVKNNTVVSNSNGTLTFMGYSVFSDLTLAGNVVTAPLRQWLLEVQADTIVEEGNILSSKHPTGLRCFDITFSDTGGIGGDAMVHRRALTSVDLLRHYLYKDPSRPLAHDTQFLVKFRVESGLGWNEIEVAFAMSYSAGSYYITWTESGETSTRQDELGSYSADGLTMEKLSSSGNGPYTLDAVVRDNASEHSNISITGVPAGRIVVESTITATTL